MFFVAMDQSPLILKGNSHPLSKPYGRLAAFSMIMANLQEFFKWCFAGDILWLFGLVSCNNLNLYQFRLRMWCLWFWSMFLQCIFICGLRFQPCIQYCIQCICVVGHSVQLCWKNLLCRKKFMSDCIFHIIISRYLEFEGRGSLSHTALFCHDSRGQSNKYTFVHSCFTDKIQSCLR